MVTDVSSNICLSVHVHVDLARCSIWLAQVSVWTSLWAAGWVTVSDYVISAISLSFTFTSWLLVVIMHTAPLSVISSAACYSQYQSTLTEICLLGFFTQWQNCCLQNQTKILLCYKYDVSTTYLSSRPKWWAAKLSLDTIMSKLQLDGYANLLITLKSKKPSTPESSPNPMLPLTSIWFMAVWSHVLNKCWNRCLIIWQHKRTMVTDGVDQWILNIAMGFMMLVQHLLALMFVLCWMSTQPVCI